jgi:hypothetical protein
MDYLFLRLLPLDKVPAQLYENVSDQTIAKIFHRIIAQ